jgi:hypothetical protein
VTISVEARWLVETVGVRVLPDVAVLQVAGDDARTWLNGQVTNDVRSLKKGDAVYALVIHVRGKIVADTWVIDRGDDVVLLLPRDALAKTREELERYIIMEDVTLIELEHLSVISVQGPRAADAVVGEDAYPCHRLGATGFDVIVPEDQEDAALGRILERARALGGGEVGSDGWELARLRLGVPAFGADFGDQNYPQEAGLRERAVSFTKGCYVGQEVVCTLENRGQLVRRLVALDARDGVPVAGADLVGSDGAVLGKVTSALVDPDAGRALALGYLKRAAAQPGTEVRAGDTALAVRAVVGDANV